MIVTLRLGQWRNITNKKPHPSSEAVVRFQMLELKRLRRNNRAYGNPNTDIESISPLQEHRWEMLCGSLKQTILVYPPH